MYCLLNGHQSPPTANNKINPYPRTWGSGSISKAVLNELPPCRLGITRDICLGFFFLSNCSVTVHFGGVTVRGVPSSPFSVHNNDSGVERLSHISTAMAVHFLINIYNIFFPVFLVSFFFQFENRLFYSDALYNNSQQTYSRQPSL